MLLVDALAWESLARRLHGSSSFALQACMLRRVRAEYCIVLYPVLQRGVAVRLPRRPPLMPKGAGRPDRARRWDSHFRPITSETVSGAGTRIRVSVRGVWCELRARNLLHSEKVQQDAGRPHASRPSASKAPGVVGMRSWLRCGRTTACCSCAVGPSTCGDLRGWSRNEGSHGSRERVCTAIVVPQPVDDGHDVGVDVVPPATGGDGMCVYAAPAVEPQHALGIHLAKFWGESRGSPTALRHSGFAGARQTRCRY